MSIVYTCHYDSPLGGITMASDGELLVGLWFEGQKYFADSIAGQVQREAFLPIFDKTAKWLDIYFSGRNPDFTPALSIKGTPFRMEVWEILQTIPYGETITYGKLAERIAKQKGLTKMSAQAIGGAVGHNPISLIVPCHRVVGAAGSLTGYAGGLDKKAWLLSHERL